MNSEKISTMIKETRKKQNLTQQEFAKKFNVTYQAVSKWETGKNIPDIAILTKICKEYHYDINEFLQENYQKKSHQKNWLLLLIVTVGVFLCIFYCLMNHKPSSFEFKTLSSNCDNFSISGSIAYNDLKTSIYISHISYCGEVKDELYQDIECALYETSGNTETKIDSCSLVGNNKTLEEFLKDVKFQIDDYVKTCQKFTENSLHLEIEAKTKDGKSTIYKIPLKLEKNCN